MSPQQLRTIFKYFMLAGCIRLASNLLFSLCHIKGVYYLGNSISHIFFWLAGDIVIRKVDFKVPDTGKIFSILFLFYSINDFLDEILFDPKVFGWNEGLFFFGSLIWAVYKYQKSKQNA